MTSIKSLKDKNGDSFFPVTHISAIYDSDGKRGELVQAKEIVDVIDFNLEDNIINKVNNIENDLNEFKNEFKKAENTKYTTENGIKEFSCENGYIDNIVIEGETLVNLSNTSVSSTSDSTIEYRDDSYKRITNGVFTFINLDTRPVYFDVRKYSTPTTYIRKFSVEKGNYVVHTVSSEECVPTFYGYLTDGWTANDLSALKQSVIILEGDYTNKSISYFEGLKSIGQGDKIEALTYNKANNLIEDTFTYTEDMVVHHTDGELRSAAGHYACDNYIEIEPSTDYMFIGINGNRAYYDENKQVVPPINNSYLQGLLNKTNGSKKGFAIEKSPSNARYIRISIHKDNLVNGKAYLYKSSNYDHKKIPTTLRSLPNGVKDTIEKQGNKYVLVQRCGEYTYIGEDFDYYASNDTMHHIQINLNNIKVYDSTNISNIVSNLLPHPSNSNDINFRVFIKESSINITLPLSNHTDEDSIKNYLKTNNFTAVYELETPQIIELSNFNPQIYEGDTTLFLNTGVIQGECEFEVTNSKGSEIEVLKDKVNSLDDYESGYEYSNEIIYLNGTYKPNFAETPYVVRIGKLCILHCVIGNDAPQRGMQILKLPSFAKPKAYHRCGGRGKINDETTQPVLVDYDITLDNTVKLWSTNETTKVNELYIHIIWEVE